MDQRRIRSQWDPMAKRGCRIQIFTVFRGNWTFTLFYLLFDFLILGNDVSCPLCVCKIVNHHLSYQYQDHPPDHCSNWNYSSSSSLVSPITVHCPPQGSKHCSRLHWSFRQNYLFLPTSPCTKITGWNIGIADHLASDHEEADKNLAFGPCCERTTREIQYPWLISMMSKF